MRIAALTLFGALGLAVASGMLASTCLAVLFVPAFYVVLQRWAERKQGSAAVPALVPTTQFK